LHPKNQHQVLGTPPLPRSTTPATATQAFAGDPGYENAREPSSAQHAKRERGYSNIENGLKGETHRMAEEPISSMNV